MSQLSAQTLAALCRSDRPLITPFADEKVVMRGKSYGLSAASYDVRIAHDLVLGPSPDRLLSSMLKANKHWSSISVLEAWAEKIATLPPPNALAHTEEDFALPNNVVGYVVDKSTYARRFVTAFNTLLDSGWTGNLTLELVNLSAEIVEIKAQDPIVQVAFHFLDEPTNRPYSGKYLGQTKAAHGPRYENEDGSWR